MTSGDMPYAAARAAADISCSGGRFLPLRKSFLAFSARHGRFRQLTGGVAPASAKNSRHGRHMQEVATPPHLKVDTRHEKF